MREEVKQGLSYVQQNMGQVTTVIQLLHLGGTFVKEKWLQFKSKKENNQIRNLNKAWIDAGNEAGLPIAPIFEPVDKDSFKTREDILEKLNLDYKDTTAELSDNHVSYCTYVHSICDIVKSYKQSRLDRSFKGTKNDPIDIVMLYICNFLKQVYHFEGKNLNEEEKQIKLLQAFFKNFSALQKSKRAHRHAACEMAREKLEAAIKNLRQIGKNRSTGKSLENFARTSRDLAETSFRLIVAITFPKTGKVPVASWITKSNLIANIGDEKHSCFQHKLGSIDEYVPIKGNNPFKPSVVCLAKELYKNREDGERINFNRVEIKNLSEQEIKLYLSIYSKWGPRPSIIQIVKKASPQDIKSTFIDQSNKQIQIRFFQVNHLINFSYVMNDLFHLTILAHRHARFGGEVSFYTKDFSQSVQQTIGELLKLAQSYLGNCQELFAHIKNMGFALSAESGDEDLIKLYEEFVKKIEEGLSQAIKYNQELQQLSEDPSVLKALADKNEAELRNYLSHLSARYPELGVIGIIPPSSNKEMKYYQPSEDIKLSAPKENIEEIVADMALLNSLQDNGKILKEKTDVLEASLDTAGQACDSIQSDINTHLLVNTTSEVVGSAAGSSTTDPLIEIVSPTGDAPAQQFLHESFSHLKDQEGPGIFHHFINGLGEEKGQAFVHKLCEVSTQDVIEQILHNVPGDSEGEALLHQLLDDTQAHHAPELLHKIYEHFGEAKTYELFKPLLEKVGESKTEATLHEVFAHLNHSWVPLVLHNPWFGFGVKIFFGIGGRYVMKYAREQLGPYFGRSNIEDLENEKQRRNNERTQIQSDYSKVVKEFEENNDKSKILQQKICEHLATLSSSSSSPSYSPALHTETSLSSTVSSSSSCSSGTSLKDIIHLFSSLIIKA